MTNFFTELDSYEIIQRYPFHKILNIDLNEYGDIEKIENHLFFFNPI